MTKRFKPSKDPIEVVIVTFDYCDSFVNSTETIISGTWSIAVKNGDDPNPSIMLAGLGTHDGNTTSNYIQGGISGVTYLISCIVVTTLNQTLKLSGSMTVETQS